jgi:DNA-binding transcriptional LysR family regulator
VVAPDFAKLQALVTLGDELHFGRAAARLDIEVSTLSRRIRELERQLGVELFVRSSRRVTPTPAGAAVTRQALRVLAEVAALEATAAEAALGRVGELRAAYSSASTEPMSRLLRELRERQPALTISARRGPSPRIAAEVVSGDLSFGICQGGDWLNLPGLDSVLVGAMPVDRVMVPIAHRLAGQPIVDAAELVGETLVWPPAAAMPTPPRVVPVSTEVRRAASWEEAGLVDEVAAGYGLFVCTEDAARRNPRPDVVARPLTGTDARAEHWFVRRIDDDTPALRTVQIVVDLLRTH